MIDTHCHLDAAELAPDRAEVLARARVAGVTLMVCVGSGRDLGAAVPTCRLTKVSVAAILAPGFQK